MAKSKQKYILTVKQEGRIGVVCNQHGAIPFWSEGFATVFANGLPMLGFAPSKPEDLPGWPTVNKQLAKDALEKGSSNPSRAVVAYVSSD